MPSALASGPRRTCAFSQGLTAASRASSVDRFQDPAEGDLIRRLQTAGQRVTAHPQRARTCGGASATRHQRGEGLRPGRHGRHRGQ